MDPYTEVKYVETPPRTWRRLRQRVSDKRNRGNTSTYVEKTPKANRFIRSASETPPRTWRRLAENPVGPRRHGNTSTYVEKTASERHMEPLTRKHLHVRGEDNAMADEPLKEMETPPRTWRRLPRTSTRMSGMGNTSTYVEKTSQRRR